MKFRPDLFSQSFEVGSSGGCKLEKDGLLLMSDILSVRDYLS